MLVTTLSKELVNGLTGNVTGFSTDNFPMVKFDNVATTTVEPVTLSVKDKDDPIKLIGTRTQIPLKLCHYCPQISGNDTTLLGSPLWVTSLLVDKCMLQFLQQKTHLVFHLLDLIMPTR